MKLEGGIGSGTAQVRAWYIYEFRNRYKPIYRKIGASLGLSAGRVRQLYVREMRRRIDHAPETCVEIIGVDDESTT